jgi:hydrogenase maturation protease
MLQTAEPKNPRFGQILQPARIVCLGNELASDDGIGMRIGRALQKLPLPQNVVVRFSPQVDLDLIDDLLTAQRLVFCDATRLGLEAGTVTVHDWHATASWSGAPYCCHGIGLSDLVALAAELETDVSRWSLHLVGVEADVIDSFGTQLSQAVQAALPRAVREVLKLLAAPAELLDMAERTALDLGTPSALDVALSCS